MTGFVARLGELVLRFFGAVFSALVMPFRLCFRRLRILFRRLAAAVRAAPSRDGAAPTPRRGAERAPSAARRPAVIEAITPPCEWPRKPIRVM